MKKILIILSLFLVFCKYALSEEENGRWIYYFKATDGDEFYYDIESINWTSDDIVEAWDKRIYSENSEFKKKYISLLIKKGVEPEKAMGLSDDKVLYKIDIKNKKIIVLSSVAYDKNGNALDSGDYHNDSTWLSIPPDSRGETLWKIMCELKEIRKLKREIEKDPDNSLLYFILSLKYYNAFLFNQAQESSKKYAEIVKKNIDEFKGDKDKACEYYFKLGIAGLKEGNKEFTKKIVKLVLENIKAIDPSSPYITELEEKIKETYPEETKTK